ncbi:alpha/beta hydrolase family protein [Bacillus sp. Marseille-P3661]|uniref:alpha/beta hydrolase family protein n=1 Tax=Bacillus sp. Marseille-P3661 TaxID=1936234 RepID=UPI000C84C737|nr:prolyl oligopeptidase family serine peptidase [Bacillus sp. Marseille-P3661]
MENGEIIYKQKYPSPHPRIEVYLVTYISDGLKVKGFLAEPTWKSNDKTGLFPGFLYLRGGIKNVGMVRLARITQFASEGFVVMAPFYRGNCGGEGFEDFGGEDRKDALYALDLLKQHPLVNNEKLHVFGFSRGGVMALTVGIERPDITSLVTWGGVSDMALTYRERVDLRRMMKRVIGGTPEKVPDRYSWRTPLNFIEELKAPVLIIHGAKDQNVSVDHAYLLEKKLLEHNHPFSSWIYHDHTHYFPPQINRKVVRELTKWMNEK